MTFNLTVSPDFAPERISGWYIFNTWLQKETGKSVHLELYDDFASQRADIARGKVDLIYANPSDAAFLVREHGFVGVARPLGVTDEVVVAVADESPYAAVEDLRPGTRIAATDHPDIRMMGMILLEPADLGRDTTTQRECATYVLVAKALLTGQADVGFFLKAAYDDLASSTKKRLRPLVTSQIQVVRHGLLAGTKAVPHVSALRHALLGMTDSPKGRDALANLGFTGWENFEQEDVEFMIDLMDTLVA